MFFILNLKEKREVNLVVTENMSQDKLKETQNLKVCAYEFRENTSLRTNPQIL